MKEIVVLYICIDENMGGSTQSLLNLIHSVRGMVKPIVLVPYKCSAYDAFIQNGIECYAYPFHKLYKLKENRLVDVLRTPWRWHVIKKIRFDYGCYRFLKKVIGDRKINIVHSNTSPNDIGVLLARKFRAKHVWHIREFCDLDFNFDIYKGIPRLRKLINKADARIAISTAIYNHWQLCKNNTWVINNAVRSKSDAYFIPKKDKYLLFSSYHLTEAKGTRKAIIAFAKSCIAKDGYILKLLGNCTEEYKDSLLETIDKYDIRKYVEFVSCQTDVKPYFIKATAYIMASIYEGLGRVTAEAMFYGCPVIAHASGGSLDLIQDGITGYLFSTEDECANIIKKVCNNDQSEIILNAQDFAIMNLSQECYAPKIMNVYSRILL